MDLPSIYFIADVAIISLSKNDLVNNGNESNPFFSIRYIFLFTYYI